MHVKGWRADFCLASHATSARLLSAQKPGAVDGQTMAGQTDRDLNGWNGRGGNSRLLLTPPLPWATGIAAHGSGRVILHGFYKVSWKILAALGKQILGMICSCLLFVWVTAEGPTNSVCDLGKTWETGRHQGGGGNIIILMLCEHCRGS